MFDYNKILQKTDSLRMRDDYLILAIESSCDETAVSVTRGRHIVSSVISSQIEIHKRFGGVVPEIASRNHALAIDSLVGEALERASVGLEEISAVAVTYGAGLLGALLVGVSYAKGLAYALDLPLIAVDHIKGHMAANYIAYPELEVPFVCLLASGGHTELVKVNNLSELEVLGSTQDDAAGEAFDKVARVLGLPYPGGPEIEKLAAAGSPTVKLPKPFKGEKHLNFSFSGVKTAVINYCSNADQRGEVVNRADLARSFQDHVTQILTERAIEAAKRTGLKIIALAGGVGANGALRTSLELSCAAAGFRALLPPKVLCTDNAAMIGVAAYELIKLGKLPADLSLDADPSGESRVSSLNSRKTNDNNL